MANRNVAQAVRTALIAASAASAAMYGTVGFAQEQLDEIVVTGSRIVRPDYEAASPVVSLTAETFKQSGVVNAEQLVNTLPQVVPSFSSGNNNPGGGQSYINLRGLGSVRNLVLMDGKRLVPGNESALVDINTIPTAMIERIDVVSGGASAVYGSDAIAGATNFIMKKNFTGIEVSGQYGISEEGDADTGAISVTMGSDLADGRGNVVVFATFNDRKALSKGDREFSAQAVSGTSFFPSGHLRRASGNAWTVDAQTDIFENLYNSTAPAGITNMVFNDDGTMFAGTGLNNFRSVIGEGQDGLYFAQNFPNGPNTYSYNFEPWNNLIIPQTRTSAGVFGNFAITDKVEAYTRILLTNYSSSTQLAPSPAPTGANNSVGGVPGEFTIPVTNPFVQANPGVLALANSRVENIACTPAQQDPLDEAFIPDCEADGTRTGDNPALLGSGPNEDLLYRYRFVSNGPRKETYERDVYQILLGTRGNINDNWSFDVYAANGKFNEQLDQAGNVSVPKVEQLLDAADGGVSLCEGGFNPFGFGGLSPACADFVGVTAKNTAQIEHNMAEGTISGDLFSLPSGAVSTTFGAFWQEMTYRSLKDEILRSGDVSGFNAEDNISGRVSNTDLFVEFYVPLLSDMPAVENLSLTGGYRYSDNTPSGTNSSYKAELDWTINDSFRVRGGYQRAVRAPNIAELYSPQNEDNPEVDDPCNYDSVERNGPDRARVEALCIAQGIPASVLGTAGDPNAYKQSNSQIDALAGGNPDLKEETADTYTLGVVWTPDFAEQLSVSLDYYNIEVSDAISSIDPSTVVARCFNADGANPDYETDNFYCSLFSRFTATSEIKDLEETQNNIGGIRTSGVDLQIDWGFSAGNFGDVNVNFVTTYVNNFERQELPGDIWQDFVGTIGDNVGDTLPDWKASLTGVWNYAGFSTMLRLRYLPSMELEDSVISGSTDPGVDSVLYADLSTLYQFNDALSLRLGIENLTNEDPQLYSPDVDSGTDPSTYDVIGRRYFVTATYKF